MPITKSAKKALRNSGKKRVFNLKKKDAINKAVKNLKALVSKKDTKGANPRNI
jgi:ribosomal protein S20